MKWCIKELKWPTSTNRKKTWKKTDLEKLLNPKSPLESQKKKWQTDPTKCSTEYKVSKALIIDLDTSTQAYRPSKRTTYTSQNARKSNKRLKGLKEKEKVWHIDFRLTDSCQKQKTSKQLKIQRDRDKQTLPKF